MAARVASKLGVYFLMVSFGAATAHGEVAHRAAHLDASSSARRLARTQFAAA